MEEIGKVTLPPLTFFLRRPAEMLLKVTREEWRSSFIVMAGGRWGMNISSCSSWQSWLTKLAPSSVNGLGNSVPINLHSIRAHCRQVLRGIWLMVGQYRWHTHLTLSWSSSQQLMAPGTAVSLGVSWTYLHGWPRTLVLFFHRQLCLPTWQMSNAFK